MVISRLCIYVSKGSIINRPLELHFEAIFKMPKRASSDLNGEQSNGVPKATKIPKPSGHWAMGLLETMKNPEFIIQTDDLVTVIKDAYPKAQYHYLILPNTNINTLKSLNKDHVDLLKHMEKVANDIINKEEHKQANFKIGYHAEASMSQLHLHVISDDMNSPCVKTKKHWNSFTTDFFLRSEDIIENLKGNGKVILPSKETCRKYMETPLKCHKCDYIPKHMPDLKKHIVTHLV